ncbi:MAG: cytidine deaminase [Bacillota bacterium]|jgi:cytidine deaminase
MDYLELVQKAKEASKKSYSPYSRFPVGAALLTKSGKVFTGCNVENASFGLTICAERTAIYKAVSEGETEFLALAVFCTAAEYCTPCGACRQVINEFGSDIDVIMSNAAGDYTVKKSAELLPGAFALMKRKAGQ